MALTLRGALALYESGCTTVCPTTMRKNVRVFKQFIAVLGADTLLGEIGRPHAAIFQAHLQRAGKSPSTVNTYTHGCVGSVLGWLASMGEVQSHPFERTKRLRVPKKDPTFWTDDEFGRLLAAVEAVRWRDPTAAIRWRALLLTTHVKGSGLRVGEALNLRWDDIDLDVYLLRVRSRPQKIGEYWAWEPKGRKDRTVVVYDELFKVLCRLRTVCRWRMPYLPARRYHTLKWRADISYDTTRTPANNLYRAWQRIKAAAGVESDGAFHKSRRTAATILSASLSMADLQAVFGWQDPNTSKPYIACQREALLARARKADTGSVAAPGLEPGTNEL